MKNYRLLIGVSLLLCFILFTNTGCEENETNSLTDINLTKTGNIQFALNKTGTTDQVDTVTALLTRSGYLGIKKNLFISGTTASITINDVASGDWQLLVEAKNSLGEVLYRGSTNVNVLGNKTTFININLLDVQGLGDLSINVTWDQGNASLWTKLNTAVLKIGGSGAFDSKQVYKPSVIYDGDQYRMWYSGQDMAINHSVGYAYSSNGIDWTKNPVPVTGLTKGAAGEWDGVAVSIPTVLFDGIKYRAWYVGSDGPNRRIGYAESNDGLNWVKHPDNPVLIPGNAGEWDQEYVLDPYVIYTGTGYKMWYSGKKDGYWQIGLAESSDGITWTKSTANPVLRNGNSGEWDDKSLYSPSVIYNGSTYKMWFSAENDVTRKIGLAESTDGVNWVKNINNPVLDIGNSGNWDNTHLGMPCVLFDGSSYKMWLGGYNGTNWQIGYAESVK